MAYASITDVDLSFVEYGFDHSGLPASLTTDGIEVRLDAWKDETGGSGVLKLRVRLSWDGGTSWTAAKTTWPITSTIATYTLGSAADTWGHTWTRAQLQAPTFRVEVMSKGTNILDYPEWRVDYVTPRVYYTDTTPLTLTWSERMQVIETVNFDRCEPIVWSEHMGMTDSGSGLADGIPRVEFSGSLVDETQSAPATFLTAAAQHNAPHGVAAVFTLSGASVSRTLLVAESALVEAGAIFQLGLVELGDIVVEGAPAVEIQAHEATIVLRNTTLAAGSTVDSITQYLRDCYVIGQQVYVYVYAKEGTTWQNRLAFEGVIVGFEVTPETVEFRCQDIKKDLIELPVLEVGPGAMNYGTASDEGVLPDASSGLAVPIAIGRFDADALKTWETGSMMAGTAAFPVLPSLLGIRVPCIPLVFASDLYLKQTGILHSQTSRQALFTFGDRNAPGISLANVATSYPLSATSTEWTDPAWRAMYRNFFTWDTTLDRGLAFVGEESTDLDAIEKQLSGAGDWLSKKGDPSAATYPLAKTHPFYVNRVDPSFASEQKGWPGPIQVAAISAERLALARGTTADGHAVGTTAGVVNPKESLNTNPDSYARVPVGETLSVDFPREGQDLGAPYAIRIAVLLHGSNASSDLRASLRFIKYDAAQGLGSTPFHAPDINFSNVTTSQCKLLTAKFGTIFVDDPHDIADPTLHSWFQWKFSERGRNPLTNGDPITEQPWTLTLWSIAGEARIVHAWIDVLFRPRLAGMLIGSTPSIQTELMRQWLLRPLVGEGRRAAYVAPILPPPAEPRPLERLTAFANGRSTVQDDASGKYTGGSLRIVENPADAIGLLLDKYIGDFALRAVGTSFGSLVRARDTLNNIVGPGGTDYWRLSIIAEEKTTWGAVRPQIAAQGRGFCEKQVSASGYEWRYFVDSGQPHVDAPERYYRDGAKLFEVVDLAPDQGSFRVIPQPLDELASQFQLNYGWHPPTRKYAYKKFVSATADNLESLGTQYRAACVQTETRFGIRRKFSVDAPWVWSHKVADQLVKWYCNLRRERRLTVEFITYLPYCDLQPGHVIRFADSMSALVKYPGLDGSSAWSGHHWNVLSATIVKGPDSPLMVRVVAQEVYSEPA